MTQFDQTIDSENVQGNAQGTVQGNAQGNVQKIDLANDPVIDPDPDAGTEEVPSSELNAWRRGITPQAEIWNGRLAMLGLSVGIGVLLLVRIVSH
jgi:hypothetical protein